MSCEAASGRRAKVFRAWAILFALLSLEYVLYLLWPLSVVETWKLLAKQGLYFLYGVLFASAAVKGLLESFVYPYLPEQKAPEGEGRSEHRPLAEPRPSRPLMVGAQRASRSGAPSSWERVLSRGGRRDFSKLGERFALLEDACSAGSPVEIGYVDRLGRLTRRAVIPKGCFLYRSAPYLRAYCLLRREERTFRVERLRVLC